MNRGEQLCAWDLDGTIRPNSLLADAIAHGTEAGFINPGLFADPACPTYEEVHYFIDAITGRSRKDFQSLIDRVSEEAPQQAYPWALERLQQQARAEQHVVIFSHGPDFLVRAFARGLSVVTRARGSYFHTQGLVFSGRGRTLDKQQALGRYLRENGLPSLHFAAGDSESDLPLLTRAEHGVVVNPNEHMAALAEQHNWETVRTDPQASLL